MSHTSLASRIVFFGCLSAILSFTPRASATPRWANGIDAQLVLGQADFTSSDPENSISRIRQPESVAVDPTTGKVFVADWGNNRVLRFASYDALVNGADADGVFGQSNFESTGGANGQDRLFRPSGVCVDSAGRLWVSDQNNNRILRYDNASSLGNGPLASGILGQTGYGTSTGAFGSQSRVFQPIGLAVDASGNLFVVDSANHRVLMFADAANLPDSSNAALVLGQEDFSGSGVATQQDNFSTPTDVVLDGAGNLYVSDKDNNRILRFDGAASKSNGDDADAVFGQVDFNSGVQGAGTTGLSTPRGLALGSDGRLWIADSGNGRVVAIDDAATAGNGAAASLVIGRPDFTVSAPAEVSASRLEDPSGVEVTPAGSLFVADRAQNRVLLFKEAEFQPDLTIGKSAGSQRGLGTLNGSGSGQKLLLRTRGREAKFAVFVHNANLVSDRYFLRSARPTAKLGINLFRVTGGRSNVTAAAKTGKHLSNRVASGGSAQYDLRVEAVGKAAEKRKTLKAYLQGTSSNDVTKDRVNAWVKNRP